MTGVTAALLALVALAGLVAGLVWQARRQGAVAARQDAEIKDYTHAQDTHVAAARAEAQSAADRRSADDRLRADKRLRDDNGGV